MSLVLLRELYSTVICYFCISESYIRLEDVTCRFKNPSVMDVKMGPVTYDMEADEAKIAREKAKFPALSKVGFQIVGFKVNNVKCYAKHN